MREIKYRAWNKEWKMLLPVDSIIFENGLAVEVRVTIKASDYDHQDEWQDYRIGDEIILQQYTELKDKNGKEIYEGDIVTSVKFKDGSNYNEVNLHIYYEDAHFGVGMAYLSNVKELKVIGNIYENKDLLKN